MVCVQTLGSRENVGDLNSRGTFCGNGARLTLPVGTVAGPRGAVGPQGPRGDRGPAGEPTKHGIHDLEWIKVIATLLEIVGLFLLAKEVYRAQEAEMLEHGLLQTRRLQFLYTTGAYRDFYLAVRLDKGRTPKEAQKDARQIEDLQGRNATATARAFETAVHNEWDWIADHASGSLTRWDTETAERLFKWRRRQLFIGASLLGVAATLHLLA
jgi:hypothetical protein